MSKSASFLFYGALNDFLLPAKRNTWIAYPFNDTPSIKHAIETIGIPHPEVSALSVNGMAVDFSYPLQNNDKVEVYPAGTTVNSLLTSGTFQDKFILDVHLGKLAKALRLFGFDTRYENDYDDKKIIEIAEAEQRIILTRDVSLLKHKAVTMGCWIRSQHAEEQLQEVIKRYDLETKFKPFERCVECNGKIISVSKESVFDKLLPKTKLYYNDFFQCSNCKRIYWRGSHYEHMEGFIERIESSGN